MAQSAYITYPNDASAGGFKQVTQSNDSLGTPFVKFLTNTGVNNANGNYSLAVTDFTYQPTTVEKFYWETFDIQVSTSAAMNQTDYGSVAGGLTNGVKFFVSFNGTEVPLVGGFTVKQNVDWFVLTHDVTLSTFAGNASTLAISFRIMEDFGAPIVLDGSKNQKLIARLNDNFSTLVVQRFAAKGRIINNLT